MDAILQGAKFWVDALGGWMGELFSAGLPTEEIKGTILIVGALIVVLFFGKRKRG